MKQIYLQGSDYVMQSDEHGCFGYMIVYCKDKKVKPFQFVAGNVESQLKAQSKAIALIQKRSEKKEKIKQRAKHNFNI